MSALQNFGGLARPACSASLSVMGDVRSANIEAMVRLQVERKAAEQLFRRSTRPAPFTVDRPGRESEVSCLELGTYCGYSTLLIARNLEEGSIGPGPPGAVKCPWRFA